MITSRRGTVLATIVVLLAVPAQAQVASPASATISTSPTSLVSASQSGAPANQPASQGSVSADGRYVAFVSNATNLAAPATGRFRQIFRRDLTTGAVELVSIAGSDAAKAGDEDSYTPSISADGSLIAFSSQASNLDAASHPNSGQQQVYVRDMRSGGSVRMLSLNAGLSAGGNGTSSAPKISSDGSTLAFASDATDLQSGVVATSRQVYISAVAAISSPSIRVVSLQDAGRSSMPDLANARATLPSISGDGRLVTFMTRATNLTSTPVSGALDQGFVHDVVTGSTRLVTVSADGRAGADGVSESLVISSDGTHAAFSSLATNLQVGQPTGFEQQVFVRDLATSGPSILVSRRGDFGVPANREAHNPTISGDGRQVAFVSSATNLSYANVESAAQVFVRDTALRTTTMLSGRHADRMDGGRYYTGEAAISGDGSAVLFESGSPGLTEPQVDSSNVQVYESRLPESRVQRIGGSDRYGVSAAISADSFGPDAAVAYVAAGTDYPDALSGSVSAGLAGGPVLLVMKETIPTPVAAELARLRPKRIVILGGTNSVSNTVQSALATFSPDVSRIGGADRYVVSAAISAKAFPVPASAPVAYVASGENFPDALSGSARAGREGGPVLLATKNGIPAAVQTELGRLKPGSIVILGGENSISADVAASLALIAPVSRIGGADRYVVSAAVSATHFDPPSGTVYLALGSNFPDALSGSAVAVAAGAPVLLVQKDSIPGSVRDAISRLKPYRIVVLGGPNSVSPAVETQLAALLSP